MGSDDVFGAISAGDLEQLKGLVAQDASVARARDEQGVSAVLSALYHRRHDMTDVLLDAGPPLDVFDTAALGRTDQVADLIDGNAALANVWSPDGFTPLHYAAFFGHPDTARLLVERGAGVAATATNELQVQPLHSAAASGSAELVTLLLEAGAPVNATHQGGFTALHAAATPNNMDMARELLRSGADTQQLTADGKTAHDLAASQGHQEMAVLLAER